MVARMRDVTVGRRLSEEWAMCDDGTAAVARMGEVTMGRLLRAALKGKHFGRSGRGRFFGGEGRRQQYWRTLGIFLCLGSSSYVLRSRGTTLGDLGRSASSDGEGRRQKYRRPLGIFLCLGSSFNVLRALTLARSTGEVTVRLLKIGRRRSREWER